MAVGKRQGREKPAEIEQRSKEGPRTRVRTSGKTAHLAKPNLHRAGPGEGKKYIKRGAKGLSLSFSPACWGTLLLESLDRYALMPGGRIFLLFSK